jgi:hypothetical protein
MRNNDWATRNTYAEAAKRSTRFAWQANCLLKMTPWTTVFHMPCSFHCPITMQYTTDVLVELSREDGDYARAIAGRMKSVVLAFSERSAFVLKDASCSADDAVAYAGVTDLNESSPVRAAFEIGRLRVLRRGDRLSIRDGRVLVFKQNRFVDVIESRCDDDIVEIPLLLNFE